MQLELTCLNTNKIFPVDFITGEERAEEIEFGGHFDPPVCPICGKTLNKTDFEETKDVG